MIKKTFSESFDIEDSNKICEKLKSESQQSLKEHEQESKRNSGIINQKVDNCRFQGSLFFIDISGKYDEKLLKKAISGADLKIKNENEFEAEEYYIQYLVQSSDLDKIVEQENIGIIRYTFPGKIKNVTPNIGKISGNTWTIDKPLTSAELSEAARSNGKITITAERYGSKLGLILGITIPLALIIAAVIVLLIVRSNRKKKQHPFPPYPAGSGAYPPPFMPGNSAYPTQPRVPGYQAAPEAPGMPGAASYPPNLPPPGQPAAPTPGGYYPYPYPPTATQNPQNPAGGQPSMPNQGYNSPTPGFPVPQAPSQPTPAGATAAPEPPEQANRGKHRANTPPPNHSADPGSLK